jgi:hypothetical protein
MAMLHDLYHITPTSLPLADVACLVLFIAVGPRLLSGVAKPCHFSNNKARDGKLKLFYPNRC